MSKTLIIAEKPSVANDIARALGGFTKKEAYFESETHVLSWAVGHLLELTAPEKYEVKRGKWSFAHLPVIPLYFDLKPIAKNEARLKLLTKLIKRKDIDRLINACDAGREGELIFRTIIEYTKAKQPIFRLWLQSMTPKAIREGFEQLRNDADMLPLADAARCRSEADWLVGINGTRAMTAFNNKEGGFFLTTVGRVQTPTLSIVVEREEKIHRFVPREYWEVKAEFSCAMGIYEGRWFDPNFHKNKLDPEQRESRLWQFAQAQAIVTACQGRTGSVQEESKTSTQLSPLLFDLTSLQREANNRFGFSAKNTLSIAQALYEKHKVLTYPRTDSHALPENYVEVVQDTLRVLDKSPLYTPLTQRILEQNWVHPQQPSRRVFNNAKISDHFAIIPTVIAASALSEVEQKLYDLVVRRFLAVFFPAAEYRVTTRITTVVEHLFKTEGKILVKPGWLQVYGREIQDKQANLVPVAPKEKVQTQHVAAHHLETKPPARYSEATLLSAMESAGKWVEDDELRAAMEAKGLGTPATRAAIIEGLLTEKYLLREERELIPTAKASQLMTLLRGLGVQELTAPELTGEWEFKLAQMQSGQFARQQFMQEIAKITQVIVNRAKEYNSNTIPGDYATLSTPCPKCESVIKENYRRFACTQCTFSITKIPAGRQFEISEVEDFLKNKEIGPLTGFRSKMGRPFSAVLKLQEDKDIQNYKLTFDFGQSLNDAEIPDFSTQTPLGSCPKCQHQVFEYGMNYLCEHAVPPEKTCDFRSAKVILQQEISVEQMKKLLESGRTDLLTQFKSSRTHRPFKAYLTLKKGQIGFEFDQKKSTKKGDQTPTSSMAKAKKGNSPGKKSTTPAKRITKKIKQ